MFHQAQSIGKDVARQEYVYDRDILQVARVASLRDVLTEIGWVDGLGAPISVANDRLGFGTVSKDGDGRCHRHDPDREDGLADKRIQERGLPALELTETSNEELFGREAFGKRSRLSRHILRARRLREHRDAIKPFSIDGGNGQRGSSRLTEIRVRRTSRSGPLRA